MKVAVFDTHAFETPFYAGNQDLEFKFFDVRLTSHTAGLVQGFDAVCVFTNDRVNAEVIAALKSQGVRLIATRSAGFNQIDLSAAEAAGIPVVRVPEYSPYAVAEHAVCLALALNRKIHKSYLRVREGNFSLNGLVGFDFHGKTVGVIGTGRIGSVFARIMSAGFGCEVLAYDPVPCAELIEKGWARYVSLDELYRESHLISLHLPLTPESRHMIDSGAISRMRHGVMLINTGRGALVDTSALISALKTGQVGAAGLDVYEEEEDLFFKDLSDQVIGDDVFARLLTFPNVIVTSHQAFLTQEALRNIAQTTLENLRAFAGGRELVNEVRAKTHVKR